MDFEVRINAEEMGLLRDSVQAEWKREHDRIAEGMKRLHALHALQLKLSEILLGAWKREKR